jgi:hypothetical protein
VLEEPDLVRGEDSSLRVLDEGTDMVLRHRVGGFPARGPATLDEDQLLEEPDPEPLLAVDEQRLGECVGPAPKGHLESQCFGIASVQAMVREAPEAAAAVEGDAVDAVGFLGRVDPVGDELRSACGLPVSFRGRGRRILDETGQPSAVRPEPETSPAVFRNGVDRGNWQPVADSVVDEAVAVETAQAVTGPEPDVALVVLVDRADQAPPETVRA